MQLRDEAFVLNDEVEIPKVGLGVFRAQDGKETYNAVRWALDFGYRHIDTAAIYGNEESVGKAVKESGVPREDIFITTKLWNSEQRYDDALKAFDTSLKKLDMDYVDLYLIHWPNNKMKYNVSAFEAMLNLKDEGKIRSVGVSNFTIEHLDSLIESVGVTPSVNQIERHPAVQRTHLKEYCDNMGIRFESWGPLMQGKFVGVKLFEDIAKKYDKTAAQVLIRWHIQGGFVAIPKSVKKERIEHNTDVFDFELSQSDMDAINNFPQQPPKNDPKKMRFGFEGY